MIRKASRLLRSLIGQEKMLGAKEKREERDEIRDPEVARAVGTSREILERNKVLVRELAAVERHLAQRRG